MLKTEKVQKLANALAEVKANAILHAIKKKAEKAFIDAHSEPPPIPTPSPTSPPTPTQPSPKTSILKGLKTSWDSNMNPKKLKKIRKEYEIEKLGSYRGMALIEKRITKLGQFC